MSRMKKVLRVAVLPILLIGLIALPVYADIVGELLKANIFSDRINTTFGSAALNNDVTIYGDFTVTGTFTGGSAGLVMSNGETVTNPVDSDVIVTYDDDAVNLGSWILKSSNTSVSALDYVDILGRWPDSGGTATDYAYIQIISDTVTDSAETGSVAIGGFTTGTSGRFALFSGSAAILDAASWANTEATLGLYVNSNVNYLNASAAGVVTLPATSHEYQFTDAKLGTTAGWATRGANNIWHTTCPASQSGSTLVIPVELRVGQTITAFKVVGQIESAGNTATLDADLRKVTTAADDLVDASVGAITQISVTADTAVATEKTSLSDTVAATETFYVLLTATTAAATDIDLQGVTVTVTEN